MSRSHAHALVAPAEAERRRFPTTRWGLILQAAGEPTAASREALEELARAYRAPLLDFARRVERDPQRAEDLVQDFLAHQMDRLAHGRPNVIGAADPSRGSFRSFLRSAFRNFVRNAHDAATTIAHGGGAEHVPVHDREIPSSRSGTDLLYDRAWARALLDRTLSRLADHQSRAGKGPLFEALRDRLADDEGPPLREVGQRLGKSEGAVKVALFHLRQRYAELLRAEVAATVARAEDVDDELHHLLSCLVHDDGAT